MTRAGKPSCWVAPAVSSPGWIGSYKKHKKFRPKVFGVHTCSLRSGSSQAVGPSGPGGSGGTPTPSPRPVRPDQDTAGPAVPGALGRGWPGLLVNRHAWDATACPVRGRAPPAGPRSCLTSAETMVLTRSSVLAPPDLITVFRLAQKRAELAEHRRGVGRWLLSPGKIYLCARGHGP